MANPKCQAAATSLLSALPEAEHDKLFPLLADGPKVVELLTGWRPHKTVLWRHARKGVAGVKLRTVSVGGRRVMCTPRWLVEFWAAVDAARRAPSKQRRHRRVLSR